ncbi:hypothetical protein HUA74_19460 [Myxococcus sp. CA051A]|uniref:hypothetical protein n=1 Tax=Myxococcus sp. CA051A TaxID=2741739 RepID=UPI00157B1EEA|nr:hypothetical protein [Myxococcus sp. CA051A]NTX62828.1 hypothetical protein [Myxococcus sp. CA051A]
MENFILWNAAMQDDERTLGFAVFATAVKQLHQGSREMVEQMLSDLGIPNTPFTSWRVSHFATNYLADDLDADDWEDIWNDHWQVEVQLAQPLQHTWSDFELRRSFASDSSWTGEPSQPPMDCLVVADFLDGAAIPHAEVVLKQLEALRSGALTPSELQREVAEAPPTLIAELAQELGAWPDARIDVKRWATEPERLLISLGRFDTDFFESGATLAIKVQELCQVLGGVTTWSDLMETQD